MRAFLRLVALGSLLLLASCAAQKQPKSFAKSVPNAWSVVELREGISYDHAWSTVISILVRDFDLETVLKDDGYVRTAWLYTWTGQYQSNYRVRVTAKFSEAKDVLSLKMEAQTLAGTEWLMGVDARLVSTLKTDLMGTIGRTTR